MKQNDEEVDWAADVADIVYVLRDEIEKLAEAAQDMMVFCENKKARDEKRLKLLRDDKQVLPFPMFPELARMIGEMENSHLEYIDYVDNTTMKLEEMAKGLKKILNNRLFQHPLSFARLQKWEVIDYMDKLHWHIYTRGPITREELKERLSPYSDRMFEDALSNLVGTGHVEKVSMERGGSPKEVLRVPEGTEHSLINIYLWNIRKANLSRVSEKVKRDFETAYRDFDRVEDSVVYASTIAEILCEPNLALPLGTIVYRFNRKFNIELEKLGEGAVKKSHQRILAVLQEMEKKGFVERVKDARGEKWALNKDAYVHPHVHRVKEGKR